MQKESYIKSIEFQGNMTIVRIKGEITFRTLSETQNEFRAKTNGKAIKNILFDLNEVTLTDASGIAALVDLLKFMKEHHTGGKVGLINVSSRIKSLFTIFKTEPLFEEFNSEKEAIEALC